MTYVEMKERYDAFCDGRACGDCPFMGDPHKYTKGVDCPYIDDGGQYYAEDLEYAMTVIDAYEKGDHGKIDDFCTGRVCSDCVLHEDGAWKHGYACPDRYPDGKYHPDDLKEAIKRISQEERKTEQNSFTDRLAQLQKMCADVIHDAMLIEEELTKLRGENDKLKETLAKVRSVMND